MEEMKDRIRQIMESQHMSQQTFANFIGMSAASLSSIFNNRTKPTLNTVEAIKSKMPRLSTDWLMFGRGSMFIDDTPTTDHLLLRIQIWAVSMLLTLEAACRIFRRQPDRSICSTACAQTCWERYSAWSEICWASAKTDYRDKSLFWRPYLWDFCPQKIELPCKNRQYVDLALLVCPFL